MHENSDASGAWRIVLRVSVVAPESAHIAELLARLDELRHAERRAAGAHLVAVAGHLVGTPLNVIAGRAALIRSNPTPEGIEENLRRIEDQVERLAQRIRRLIDYFSLAADSSEQRSIDRIFEDCDALYRPVADRAAVELQLDAQDTGVLSVSASWTLLALTMLISLGLRTAKSGQVVRLTATEHGPRLAAFDLTLPGLPPPPHNFERLEAPEHGARYDVGSLETLWICLGLARRLGGSLSVAGDGDGGTNVRFECPHA
jgi:signal transduction histidine kinase